MSSPKSFKDMVKRYTLRPPPQKLNQIPQPKLSEAELAKRKTQLAERKKFANALRCPLCDSQLDGLVSHAEARLNCVADANEYSVWYRGRGLAKRESARVSNEFITYELIYFLEGLDDEEVPLYSICVNELDRSIPRLDIREKCKKQIFRYYGKKFLPINKNLNIENLFRKLEIYQIFQ